MKTAMTWIMGGLLVVGAATAFTGLNGNNAGAGTGSALAASAGQIAPDFTLADYQTGKPITLSDYRGKVVLVNFWATWCPPCRHEIPDFIRVQDTLRGQGLEIVSGLLLVAIGILIATNSLTMLSGSLGVLAPFAF